MTATQTQRKRNTQTRRAFKAKLRRDTRTMANITTLADAASSYAEEVYQAHPSSAAQRLASTFREIAAKIPKEITQCRNPK